MLRKIYLKQREADKANFFATDYLPESLFPLIFLLMDHESEEVSQIVEIPILTKKSEEEVEEK